MEFCEWTGETFHIAYCPNNVYIYPGQIATKKKKKKKKKNQFFFFLVGQHVVHNTLKIDQNISSGTISNDLK